MSWNFNTDWKKKMITRRKWVKATPLPFLLTASVWEVHRIDGQGGTENIFNLNRKECGKWGLRDNRGICFCTHVNLFIHGEREREIEIIEDRCKNWKILHENEDSDTELGRKKKAQSGARVRLGFFRGLLRNRVDLVPFLEWFQKLKKKQKTKKGNYSYLLR